MNVRPLYDRILVKRAEAEVRTTSGIIIPGTAQEKPTQAKVIAVGTGKINDKGDVRPLTIKVGDTVLLGKWGGTEIKINGEEYLILKEDEVLATVES